MKKFFLTTGLVLTNFFVAGSTVFAQVPTAYKIQIPQPTGALTNINSILTAAIQLILIVAGLIAFVFLLLGGIKWITSGGDKGQVEAARNQIIQALIGLIVVLATWGVIVLVENITGIGLGFSQSVTLPTFYGTPAPTQFICSHGQDVATGCTCPPSMTVAGGVCQ